MVPLSSLYIDLLNVPTKQLKKAAAELKVKGRSKLTTTDLVAKLATFEREKIEDATDGYLYAGRTSITWFRLALPVPRPGARVEDGELAVENDGEVTTESAASPILRGQPLDHQELADAITSFAGDGAFDEQLRPVDVDREPQLVFARVLDADRLLLSLVLKRRITRVIHNFAFRDIAADDFFTAVIHRGEGLAEVRASQTVASLFETHWLIPVAEELGLEVHPVGITIGDFDALKARLDAKLTRFSGKDSEGSAIDTVDVRVKRDREDLAGTDEFDEIALGLEQIFGDLEFSFESQTHTIRVSKIMGSIYFVSSSNEATIAYVFDALRAVKLRHLASVS